MGNSSSAYNFIIAYFFYASFEVLMRVSVLAFYSGVRVVSWRLLSPGAWMIVSPGYWISANCKRFALPRPNPQVLRANLIHAFNAWNLVFSIALLLIVLAIRISGNSIAEIFVCFLAWRFISRNLEIIAAFGGDIITASRRSTLSNADRMLLALRSYFEIFIYSAAFYAASAVCFPGVEGAILNSLYVGTLTNVAAVAIDFKFGKVLIFLQVFATLSLLVLGIAGYLGKVKKI